MSSGSRASSRPAKPGAPSPASAPPAPPGAGSPACLSGPPPPAATTASASTPSPAPFNGSSTTFGRGTSSPAGEVDDAVTSGNKAPGIDVVGVCKHPGFFDGDDHAIALAEFTVTNGTTCNGTYKWKQAHDSSNSHDATFWWKTRSERAGGPDLAGTLTTLPTTTTTTTTT